MLDYSGLEFDESRLVSTLFANLSNQIEYGNCSTYGNYSGNLISRIPRSFDEAKQSSKQVLAVAKVVKHVTDNLPKYLERVFNGSGEYANVKHAGLVIPLHSSFFDNDVVWFRRSFVVDKYQDVLKPHPDSSAYWSIVDAYKPSFIGDMAEVYQRARHLMIMRDDWQRINGNVYSIGQNIRMNAEQVSVQTVRRLDATYQAYGVHLPLTMDVIREARNDLMRERAVASAQDDIYKIAQKRDAFESYWAKMKQNVSSNGELWSQARESWKTIPVLESGTKSSRTWGIEVETVRADLVSRPAGWESTYDGSLESMGYDDSCNCDCGDCDDGYHDDCGDSDSCREFVSPVLTHFNSDGLRQLSNGLDGVSTNSSPGIHVHVGADDLTVMDVARLARAYSIVSPFLDAVSYRETRGYCKEMSSSNVSYWLSAVRKAIRGTLINQYGNREVLTVKDIAKIATAQPDDRYHDLNLTALAKHGTIEFRLMGPHYNYDHLVRWAWFCREMVNVSRLDLPLSAWTKLRSMADVIELLRKYGNEIPSWDNDPSVEKLSNQLNDEIQFNVEQV